MQPLNFLKTRQRTNRGEHKPCCFDVADVGVDVGVAVVGVGGIASGSGVGVGTVG